MTEPKETRTLNEPHLLIVHEKDHTITLIDESNADSTKIHIEETAAVTINKLLDIGYGELPEHHGEHRFVLSDTRTPVSEQLVVSGTPTPSLTFTNGPHNHITLPGSSIPALQYALTDWGFTFRDITTDVLTLPGMIEVDDGIVEPLLHQEFDHILEYFHEPVGYWSPEKNDYVYRR